MAKSLPVIKIKPIAKHNGLFLTLLGGTSFLFVISIGQSFWQSARFVVIFLTLVCLVTFLLGIVKLLEPKASLVLTPKTLRFNHKYGYWQTDWQHIRTIRRIRETIGLATESLPYIGICLTELSLNNIDISPRLASRIIHEQKGLLIFCIRNQLLTSEQSIINFDPFITKEGETITGPKAAFLHQCELLHKALGFHLFINRSSMDREIEEFEQLLNQCKRTAYDLKN